MTADPDQASDAAAAALFDAKLAVYAAHARVMSEVASALSDVAEALGAPAGRVEHLPPDDGDDGPVTFRLLSPLGRWLLTEAPFVDVYTAAATAGIAQPSLAANRIVDARQSRDPVHGLYRGLLPHLRLFSRPAGGAPWME